MKKSFAIAMATAAALTLSACKDEQDNKNESSNNNSETTISADDYNPERLIHVADIPVTRLGKDFTVSVNAYCNDLTNNETYTQDCAAAATKAMEQRFNCLGYPLAAGNTRSTSEAVIGAGLQGNYNEFPSQYLFTQEELEAAIELDNRSFSQENFFVITDVSDLDAASVNYTNGLTAPDICPA